MNKKGRHKNVKGTLLYYYDIIIYLLRLKHIMRLKACLLEFIRPLPSSDTTTVVS